MDAPNITFSDEPNEGLYSTGGEVVSVSRGGTVRLTTADLLASLWRPIDTAPRDGSVFIGDVGVPWLFAWVEEQPRKKASGRWPFRKTETVRGFSGFHGVIPSSQGGYDLMWLRSAPNQPKRWMPLPPTEDN